MWSIQGGVSCTLLHSSLTLLVRGTLPLLTPCCSNNRCRTFKNFERCSLNCSFTIPLTSCSFPSVFVPYILAVFLLFSLSFFLSLLSFSPSLPLPLCLLSLLKEGLPFFLFEGRKEERILLVVTYNNSFPRTFFVKSRPSGHWSLYSLSHRGCVHN